MRIQIKDLKKYLIPDTDITGEITCGDEIFPIRLVYKHYDKYVEFDYSTTDYYGEEFDLNYRVYIEPRKSNLGKGTIHEFRCPFSLEKCRSLYKIRGSIYFKSRQAYSGTFYDAHNYSHRQRIIYAVHDTTARLEELYNKRECYYYNGQPTKLLRRIEAWEAKLEQRDFVSMQDLIRVVEKLS